MDFAQIMIQTFIGITFGIRINDILGEDPSSISTIKWTATNEWEKIQTLRILSDVRKKLGKFVL